MTDKEYYGLIQPYEDAMKLLLTRLEVLNHSIYETKTGKPIHNIQYRIKKKDSIEEKRARDAEALETFGGRTEQDIRESIAEKSTGASWFRANLGKCQGSVAGYCGGAYYLLFCW